MLLEPAKLPGNASKRPVHTFYIYSRTPLIVIRPPSESHWCGRIRGMVAHEGFIYEQKPLSVTHGRMRGMVVGEGGRSSGVLLYCRRLNYASIYGP